MSGDHHKRIPSYGPGDLDCLVKPRLIAFAFSGELNWQFGDGTGDGGPKFRIFSAVLHHTVQPITAIGKRVDVYDLFAFFGCPIDQDCDVKARQFERTMARCHC